MNTLFPVLVLLELGWQRVGNWVRVLHKPVHMTGGGRGAPGVRQNRRKIRTQKGSSSDWHRASGKLWGGRHEQAASLTSPHCPDPKDLFSLHDSRDDPFCSLSHLCCCLSDHATPHTRGNWFTVMGAHTCKGLDRIAECHLDAVKSAPRSMQKHSTTARY